MNIGVDLNHELTPQLKDVAWVMLTVPGAADGSLGSIKKLLASLPSLRANELVRFLHSKVSEQSNSALVYRACIRLQSLLSGKPEFTRVYVDITLLLVACLQRRKRAKEALAQANDLLPVLMSDDSLGKASALLKYAVLLLQLKSPQLALEYLQQAASHAEKECQLADPTSVDLVVETRYRLGLAYFDMKECALSALWLTRAEAFMQEHQRQAALTTIDKDCREKLKAIREKQPKSLKKAASRPLPHIPSLATEQLVRPFYQGPRGLLAAQTKSILSHRKSSQHLNRPSSRSIQSRSKRLVSEKVHVASHIVSGVPVEIFLRNHEIFEVVPLKKQAKVIEAKRQPALSLQDDLQTRIIPHLSLQKDSVLLTVPIYSTKAHISSTELLIDIYLTANTYTVLTYNTSQPPQSCSIPKHCPLSNLINTLQLENNRLISKYDPQNIPQPSFNAKSKTTDKLHRGRKWAEPKEARGLAQKTTERRPVSRGLFQSKRKQLKRSEGKPTERKPIQAQEFCETVPDPACINLTSEPAPNEPSGNLHQQLVDVQSELPTFAVQQPPEVQSEVLLFESQQPPEAQKSSQAVDPLNTLPEASPELPPAEEEGPYVNLDEEGISQILEVSSKNLSPKNIDHEELNFSPAMSIHSYRSDVSQETLVKDSPVTVVRQISSRLTGKDGAEILVKDVAERLVKPKTYEFAKQMVKRRLLNIAQSQGLRVLESVQVEADCKEYRLDLVHGRRVRMLECTDLATSQTIWTQIREGYNLHDLIPGIFVSKERIKVDYQLLPRPAISLASGLI